MAVFTKPQFNTVWAASGTKTSPEVAKISLGWVVEIPPHEYANWLENRRDAMLAHLNQAGVPTWDTTVEYQAGKSYVQGSSTGVVYRCLVTNTGIDPGLDIQGNWEVAFQRSGTALLKSQNLADVPDKALARSNLGISTTADYDNRYLIKSQNLADVPNKATARGNLGLGNSAVLNVGTVGNTVAAGNDPRIVNAVPNSRALVAGNGLTGGGSLVADRVVALGTPSHVSATSGNSVSTASHSHALDLNSFIRIVGGDVGEGSIGHIHFRWGTLPVGVDESDYVINFTTPFPNACLNLSLTPTNAAASSTATAWWQIVFKNQSGFGAFRQKPSEVISPVGGEYFAIGW